MTTLYDKKYFEGFDKALSSEVPRHLRNVKIIGCYAPHIDGLKVLDVGVGIGLFLRLAKDRGWDVYGTDVSEYALTKVKRDLGVKIFRGGLNAIRRKNGYFDAINMRHTIEHIQNPRRDLQSAFALLKKGGHICISTPNSFGIHAKVYGDEWPHWSRPYHLHFFSKRSLKSLVEETGFRVLELKTEELTIYDVAKFLLHKMKIPINYNVAPSIVILSLEKLLAAIGLGEGLLLIAQKP